NGFSFWSLALMVEDYTDNEILIMSVSSGGPMSNTRLLITPIPPGTPMTLFNENDWLWAGSSPDQGISHPQNLRADYVFNDRINGLGPYLTDPQYVYTYLYLFFKSAYLGPGVAESRIFWDYGFCGYRKIYGPELNQYLLSTKDLIDENNPQYNGSLNEDLIIGLFSINCQDFRCLNPPCPSPGPYLTLSWFQHSYYAQVYLRTFIGPQFD
ncbi:MAG: hypothetical protein CVT92_09595, partial [Bacteroidetes bacterium HGW-Bacteroidetes-1]